MAEYLRSSGYKEEIIASVDGLTKRTEMAELVKFKSNNQHKECQEKNA